MRPDERLSAVTDANVPESGERPSIAQQTFKIAKTSATRAMQPSEMYKVGVGDVLFINIKNSLQTGAYCTVRNDGTIDFPLAGENVVVADQTVDDIEEILASGIKLFPDAQVEVKVREFASHKITVSGMVDHPGEKSLQREAIPLYVIRAEAGVSQQATKVLITRMHLSKIESYDLHESNTENILIFPGSSLEFASANTRVNAASADFYYIAGDVASSGQKEFAIGLTLYQAVVASGGTSGNPKKAFIRRKNEKGIFSVSEHDLRAIKNGKAPDPTLSSGDVIEIRK